MPKNIFWDFDGVMANSTPFVFEFWRKKLAQQGHVFEISDYQATFEAKFPFDYLKDRYGILGEAIKTEYTAFEANHYAQEVPFFEGMVDLLRNFSQTRSYFVVSSNLAQVIQESLTLHDVAPYFSEIIGREKPGYKDEKIEQIIDRHNLQKSECIFIGDTMSDMEHAQSAGIKCIGVTWGVHPRAKLERTNPTFLCDSVEDLHTILADQ